MNWWKITNRSEGGAELLLYGVIGDGWLCDNSSRDFAKALGELKHLSSITVRINSPGGEVSAAQAIYGLLKSHPAHLTVIIDGLCASASSLIAMAGDRIIMPVNALMMIHNPMGSVTGDGGDMLHAADVLEKFKDTMIAVYSERTGKSAEALSEMMDAETWFTAEEALKEGFIDDIDAESAVNFSEGKNGAFSVNGLTVNFNRYRNVPAAVIASSNITGSKSRKKEEKIIMNAEQLKAEYPEVYKQIYSMGVSNERERIKGIDSIRAAGYEEIKAKAKYESFEQAGKVAIDIINAQAGKLAGAAADIKDDAASSNVNNIPMGDAPLFDEGADNEAVEALTQKAVEAANKNIVGR